MGGFNRDKYKPTPMAAIKSQEQDAATKRPLGGNKNLFGKIEAGDNILRLCPGHPEGGGTTFAEAHCVSWLPVTVPVRDDTGKVIEGKTEIKRRSIFNSKVHGGTELDLTEEFLRIVNDVLLKDYVPDKAEQEAITYFLTGSNDAIKPIDTWAVYASKYDGAAWGPFEQYDLKKTIKNSLNDLAAEYNGPDPTSPDPFTDINDGIPIVINKSGKGMDTRYKTRFYKMRDGRNEVYVDAPLSDEQLQLFDKLPPLHKIYVKSYRRKDLLMQLEGLKNMDDDLLNRKLKTKNGAEFVPGISVFAVAEFQALIDRLLDLFPEGEETDEQDQGQGPEEPPFEPGLINTEAVVKSSPRTTRSTQQQPAQATRRQPLLPTPKPDQTKLPAEAPRRQQRQVVQPAPETKELVKDTPEVAQKREEVNKTSAALDERIRQIREGLGKKNGSN